MEVANWKTPAPFDTEAWKVVSVDEKSVNMEKAFTLTNYAGTPLAIGIERKVNILDRSTLDSVLGLTADTSVKAVGYRTVNVLTNAGRDAWTETNGMPCLWLL